MDRLLMVETWVSFFHFIKTYNRNETHVNANAVAIRSNYCPGES